MIAVGTAVGAFLRLYQLSRPGYLLGITEYDDGVYIGNALRLVNGAIPYRDFAVVQPPGSILLMTPVALLAKVTGTAWGLGIARLLTAGADTACVALLGVLVRHRGPVTAGVACGIYAVYPDALVAAHTFLLEPWLNLFCLVGVTLVFDGDRITSGRRLVWGGVAFGFAAAVKIWALLPLAVIILLLMPMARRLAAFAAGALAGFGVPVLPFLILAPGGVINGVLVGQFVRSGARHPPPLPRLSDLAGLSLFSGLPDLAAILLLLAIAAAILSGYVAAWLRGRRLPAALDWYAVTGLAAVTLMFMWPYGYYSHYGAFDGAFIALSLALSVGLLASRAAESLVAAIVISLAAAVVIAGVGIRQLGAEIHLRVWASPAATADRLIPPGSCVMTNDPALTITSDRFNSNTADCPSMVDSYGTLIVMTVGRTIHAAPRTLSSVAAVWQSGFARAGYVWLEAGSQGEIPWTHGLHAYFSSHFRLIGLASIQPGRGNIPRGGLYIRRQEYLTGVNAQMKQRLVLYANDCCNRKETGKECRGAGGAKPGVTGLRLPRRTPGRHRPRATARTRRSPSRPPAFRPRRTHRAPGPWRTSCAA